LRVKRVKCTTQVPKDFARAIFFDLDPPIHDDIDIASVVGGESNFLRLLLPQVIREIFSYTRWHAVRALGSTRGRNEMPNSLASGLPARVDGDALSVKWSDGKELKTKIIRREKINPNQPQPA
jgi:hypothetical protein